MKLKEKAIEIAFKVKGEPRDVDELLKRAGEIYAFLSKGNDKSTSTRT